MWMEGRERGEGECGMPITILCFSNTHKICTRSMTRILETSYSVQFILLDYLPDWGTSLVHKSMYRACSVSWGLESMIFLINILPHAHCKTEPSTIPLPSQLRVSGTKLFLSSCENSTQLYTRAAGTGTGNWSLPHPVPHGQTRPGRPWWPPSSRELVSRPYDTSAAAAWWDGAEQNSWDEEYLWLGFLNKKTVIVKL